MIFCETSLFASLWCDDVDLNKAHSFRLCHFHSSAVMICYSLYLRVLNCFPGMEKRKFEMKVKFDSKLRELSTNPNCAVLTVDKYVFLKGEKS